MDRLLLDLRLAVRRLRDNLGFTTVAVLTLALGIGANTAVFSAINAILLRPLPVEKANELVSLNQTFGDSVVPALSYPNYKDLGDRNTVLSGLAAYRFMTSSLGISGNSQRIWAYLVTGNYFDVLGVKPVRGRLLTPADDLKRGANPIAVVSYSCWQQRFGADPGVVGRAVKFNGREFTLVGVAPRGFSGTEIFFSPDVFFPMSMQKQLESSDYLDNRDEGNLFVVGRRKPGVSVREAQAALNVVARQLSQEYPKIDGGMKIVLSAPGLAGEYMRGPVIGFAAALFGISCLVLLVACTNLASLLVARAVDQRKQTAIRLALGAGRGRLIRQLLTENLVVALAGGVAGELLALWIADALHAWHAPVDFPIVLDATPDLRVFLFTLVVSAATTLLFGLLPALQATKTDLVSALKSDAISQRFRNWHLRDYLVAAQVAMSVLLMVCSVLVVRSLQRTLTAPLGYHPEGAVSVSFDLNLEGYDEARGLEFERQLMERVRSLPGVQSAALTDMLPLTLNASSDTIYVEGRPRPKPTEAPISYSYAVSPDYFRTMRTSLLMGREFEERDVKEKHKFAVVNQAFARQLLRAERPLGMRFSTGPDGKPIEVIGVVETGKYFSLSEAEKPAYFLPMVHPGGVLIVRSAANGEAALGLIRGVVREIDPAIALYDAGTLSGKLDLPLFPARLAASALGAFGLLAAILAATGIYGVMANSVSRRTREIGIRMAVGAGWGNVLGILGRRAAILIGSGTVAGLAAALLVGRLLKQLLYGVNPTDPVTFATVFALVLLIAAIACWVPARRAIRIDPIKALRQD